MRVKDFNLLLPDPVCSLIISKMFDFDDSDLDESSCTVTGRGTFANMFMSVPVSKKSLSSYFLTLKSIFLKYSVI